ncbi:IdeS/Mac family cysteine endopeptidase [Mycoplasmopsis cynos]|uniref:IdeS/Mac family cysteine endopeptidase n=1 Tax=Mycoplasmopsis cynos TaxID=171284 RepID=UPI002AFDE575|nr:IdeS/Mac family cysteine endopeptidase [Mycoplasmopsis cynos]WQQ19209.1 IdeS/Mac family cysteine endopeptidase [Mycoplasmopsis cynos]
MKKYKNVFKTLGLLSFTTLIIGGVVSCDLSSISNNNDLNSSLKQQLLMKRNRIKSLINNIAYPSINAHAKVKLNDELAKILNEKSISDANKIVVLNKLESKIITLKIMVSEYRSIILKLPNNKQASLNTELNKISDNKFSNLQLRVLSYIKEDLKDKIDNLDYPNAKNPKNNLKIMINDLKFEQILQKYNEIQQLSNEIKNVLNEINSLPYPDSKQSLNGQLAIEYFKEKLSNLTDLKKIKSIIPKDLKDKIINFKNLILLPLSNINVREWLDGKDEKLDELNARLLRFSGDNYNHEYTELALIYYIYETIRSYAFYPKIMSLTSLSDQKRDEYLNQIPEIPEQNKNSHNVTIDVLKTRLILMDKLAKDAENEDLRTLDAKQKEILEERKNDQKLKDYLKNDQLKGTELGKFLEEQGVTKTLFLKGVNLKFNEFVHYENESDDIDSWWYAHNDRNEGWFDVNKEFDRGDNFLCAAIVTANAIHYWSKQNKNYIDKYLKDPKKGIVQNTNSISSFYADFREVNKFKETKSSDNIITNSEHSELFEIFRKLLGGRFAWPHKLFDTFINGYGYTPFNPNLNIEANYERNKSSFHGFFKDVFGSHLLTNRWSFRNGYGAKYLSQKLKNEILANKILAISHTYSSVRFNHIINVWGADFDKDGILKALYVTDSDDPKFELTQGGIKKRLGMKRYKVDFDTKTGKIYIGGKKENLTQALDIYTYDLGTKYWDQYFNDNN